MLTCPRTRVPSHFPIPSDLSSSVSPLPSPPLPSPPLPPSSSFPPFLSSLPLLPAFPRPLLPILKTEPNPDPRPAEIINPKSSTMPLPPLISPRPISSDPVFLASSSPLSPPLFALSSLLGQAADDVTLVCRIHASALREGACIEMPDTVERRSGCLVRAVVVVVYTLGLVADEASTLRLSGGGYCCRCCR
ncbi:hypothetical protein PYCCODRAFT_24519 [Trametes coccinea BRFM310]|uniref:Uncharacterized protein n=1 Tax=Trametes coccinea (strain BRFM310) TaxID=1353009 RepID=A0A1Y2J6Q5_TRAC3|nr:hypothetical protein PYCCODRAFT_24519 [Trametes coccinea BRFM310]